MGKLVSVITPSFNSEKTIHTTIESILKQTYSEIEYIIVDGKSIDKTVETAESYREALEKRGISYRIISEPDNGIYDAMNKGIRMASGELIGILNSDDWYEPAMIEEAVKKFDDSGCDVVFTDIRVHKKGSSFVKKAKLRRFQTSRDWNHPTMFVKADIYKSHPFRMKGVHDDYGCYLQIRKEGFRIEVVNEVLANFCMGGASNHKSLKEAINRIRDRYYWCYRVNGYSRWYILECVMIETTKMILG